MVTIILIAIAAYLIYKVHKRSETDGLGRAIGSIFLIILGILLLVFLGPLGIFPAAMLGRIVHQLWRNI